MGEDLVKGEVYAYAEGCEPTKLGKAVSIESVSVEEADERAWEALKGLGEASVTVQVNTLKLAEAFGVKRISAKRFRKLLYSRGIQRNEANSIIRVENKKKGCYVTGDVDSWCFYIRMYKSLMKALEEKENG